MPAVLIMGMYFHRLAVYKVSFLSWTYLPSSRDHVIKPIILTQKLMYLSSYDPFRPCLTPDPSQRPDRIHLPPFRSLWTRRVRHPPTQLGCTHPVYAIRRYRALFRGRGQVVWECYLRLFHPVSIKLLQSLVHTQNLRLTLIVPARFAAWPW